MSESTMQSSVGDAVGGAKRAILVVSFGTSYNDNRKVTIGAIEDAIAAAFPGYDVRRAFTSQMIINKLRKRDGIEIDTLDQAFERLAADGISEVVVQPTHLMAGIEFNDIEKAIAAHRDKFAKCVLGDPLLASDEDFTAVARALEGSMAPYEGEGVAVCLMGHGTEADSHRDYATMQDKLASLGMNNYFVATVEPEPTFEDVAEAARAAGCSKAVLRPFMVVAGDHANNDMADEEDPESFASVMKAAGFEVQCVVEGLGQIADIQTIYVDHARKAVARL